MRLGIDVGSTTVKLILLDAKNKISYSKYERHMSNVFETVVDLLRKMYEEIGDKKLRAVITGSGGLALSKILKIPFEQEVVTCSAAVEALIPETDVAIELGGEDAKITFYGQTIEQRMNGTCAGGTGAFIDQMAVLLNTDASGLNEAAKKHTMIYPIAARCGVFAKTDIQPLINEGAPVEDLAASIFQAVVNQTISGLACGKPIRGHVAFLGGPLHFLSELKKSFIRTLNLDDEHVMETGLPTHLYAAIGSALNAKEDTFYSMQEMVDKLSSDIHMEFEVERMEPLFKDENEYEDFRIRHAKHCVKTADLATYSGDCFLGIDAGSTTTKVALVGEDGSLLYSFYSNNNGSPLKTAIKSIQEIYSLLPEGARIVRSCSTGYGEALIKAAFLLDDGEVETIAHYNAAAFFDPSVDCILDIGG